MSRIALYRELFEYEKDCNAKMLAMLESVPDGRRADRQFQRAVMLAGHLAACRENWLSHMAGALDPRAPWFDPGADLATLGQRYEMLERRWTDYLSALDEGQIGEEFTFRETNGETFRLPIEVQIVQLAGHGAYHRGQVVLLVGELGGRTVDTDYADWWWASKEPSSKDDHAPL